MKKQVLIKSNKELIEDANLLTIKFNGFSLLPSVVYYVADRIQVMKSVTRYLENGERSYDLALRQLDVVKEFLLTEPVFKKTEEESEPNEAWTPLTVVKDIDQLTKDIALRKEWQAKMKYKKHGKNLKEMLDNADDNA
ncbi:hypothetical protein [Enterococcus sp. DIV0660C]|uniref:hypothetical protein n=1 Tax=Enterococcus sp. DIV0660C TaxID=2230880 RepID=UPI001A8CC86F|nr:hypothetical protein [Enterococcus sp. DIV0660C]MBO0431336.1 hypothetical protein [Enterococcus sp. DIV0660C]